MLKASIFLYHIQISCGGSLLAMRRQIFKRVSESAQGPWRDVPRDCGGRGECGDQTRG